MIWQGPLGLTEALSCQSVSPMLEKPNPEVFSVMVISLSPGMMRTRPAGDKDSGIDARPVDLSL